nr:hypothetical protein CFP56_42983 [Quercus suber]
MEYCTTWEDGDEALADDEFKEGGNLVDEGNDAGGYDGNGDMGDVTYDWYNIDYDDIARRGKQNSIAAVAALKEEGDGEFVKAYATYLKHSSQISHYA